MGEGEPISFSMVTPFPLGIATRTAGNPKLPRHTILQITCPFSILPNYSGLAMGLEPMLPSRHTRGLWQVSIFAIEDRKRDTGWTPANNLRE